ncbi:bacteriocin immunity protein [Pediococcus pentosaceus]|uniref:bacteriocin immunity protein n=1 Tax=Pediococcus pentosaceus TaxID=1255 RepID=UPI0018A14729|nr:bacteriocin immunity protein [Pediococcus pentosaceus]MBF7108743.1 bacteriocin immunity protein [Pediococcus pentosaceus]
MSEKNRKQQLTELLIKLSEITSAQSTRPNNQYLIDLLKKATDKIAANQQNAITEARTVYQNANTICLVNKISLTSKEKALLEKINQLAQSSGVLGGINAFNAVNTWPGN